MYANIDLPHPKLTVKVLSDSLSSAPAGGGGWGKAHVSGILYYICVKSLCVEEDLGQILLITRYIGNAD